MIFFDRFSSSTTFSIWQPERMWVLHAITCLRLKVATLPLFHSYISLLNQDFDLVPGDGGIMGSASLESKLFPCRANISSQMHFPVTRRTAALQRSEISHAPFSRSPLRRLHPVGRRLPLDIRSAALARFSVRPAISLSTAGLVRPSSPDR